MKIYLIRHGKTRGNLEKRYIGTTDEPLCEQGIAQLKQGDARRKQDGFLSDAERVYVSPLRRCLETAAILFPGKELYVEDDLRECDFGEFENKNYMELAGNPAYQKWIDSMGTLPFPGGESREAFEARCIRAFWKILHKAEADGIKTIGIVAHGGTIMSIMEKTALPKGSYYDFQVENGCGYELIPAAGAVEGKFCYRGVGGGAAGTDAGRE